MTSYADQSQRYRLILAYREIHAQSVSGWSTHVFSRHAWERNREEAVQLYARHLARTALTALAHMAPEYEPVAVRTALALVQMGSTSPAESPVKEGRSRERKRRISPGHPWKHEEAERMSKSNDANTYFLRC